MIAHHTESKQESEGLMSVPETPSSPSTSTETELMLQQLPGSFSVVVEVPGALEWEERVDVTIYQSSSDSDNGDYGCGLWMDKQEVHNTLLKSGVFQRAYEKLDENETYHMTCYTLDGSDDDADIELVNKKDFAETEGEELLDAVMDRFDLYMHIPREFGGPVNAYKATIFDRYNTEMSVILAIHSDEDKPPSFT